MVATNNPAKEDSTHLANEILDSILSFIDDARDLVATSLASKRFSELVRPHIQFHTIRCTIATNDLWKALAEKPILAQHVRVLHIQKQYYHFYGIRRSKAPLPIVPKEFMDCALDPTNRKFYPLRDEDDKDEEQEQAVDGDGDVDLNVDVGDDEEENVYMNDVVLDEGEDVNHIQAFEAERLLIAALKNMVNLKSFIWDREPPYFNSRKFPKDTDLWDVLRKFCLSLREVEVVDASDYTLDGEGPNWHHSRPIDSEIDLHYRQSPVHNSNLWLLPQSLTSFTYHTYAYRNHLVKIPLDELFSLLRRCPNLEKLVLFFTLYPIECSNDGTDISTADLNPLFRDIRWPKLRHLHLGSAHVSSSTAKVFFERHQNLQSLRILENTEMAKFIKEEQEEEEDADRRQPFEVQDGCLSKCVNVNVPYYIHQSLLPGTVYQGRRSLW
ncbi:hypothetical protein M422DRAFT_71333 [Sphaerobolus stellatus SS14]|uniref:F-box domain-containing protein n=1 Tax=Sphaerobolus stellatus (strain SS14) TaxID=990650 RepID=A0A0C9UU79_SPHS4|nr:hypothetical protein M422DRAFT_71333 [Sphaerobolus stellatus SS14]